MNTRAFIAHSNRLPRHSSRYRRNPVGGGNGFMVGALLGAGAALLAVHLSKQRPSGEGHGLQVTGDPIVDTVLWGTAAGGAGGMVSGNSNAAAAALGGGVAAAGVVMLAISGVSV